MVRDRGGRGQAARGATSRSIRLPIEWRATSRSQSICRPSQNSGDMAKKRPSRSAVSAVIVRSPRTIPVMRLRGTPIALASA